MDTEMIYCSECEAVLLEDEVCTRCGRCGHCCACYGTADDDDNLPEEEEITDE